MNITNEDEISLFFSKIVINIRISHWDYVNVAWPWCCKPWTWRPSHSDPEPVSGTCSPPVSQQTTVQKSHLSHLPIRISISVIAISSLTFSVLYFFFWGGGADRTKTCRNLSKQMSIIPILILYLPRRTQCSSSNRPLFIYLVSHVQKKKNHPTRENQKYLQLWEEIRKIWEKLALVFL